MDALATLIWASRTVIEQATLNAERKWLGSVKDSHFPPGPRQSQESVSGLIYVNALRIATDWQEYR